MSTQRVLYEARALLVRMERCLDQLEALALDDLFEGRLGELREVVDESRCLVDLAEPEEVGPDDDDDDDED